MPARTPEDLDRLFAIALNAGDIEGLMRLYEPEAAMRPAPARSSRDWPRSAQALPASSR